MVPVLVVVAMAIGAVSVTYLRSVFGSDGAVVTPVGRIPRRISIQSE